MTFPHAPAAPAGDPSTSTPVPAPASAPPPPQSSAQTRAAITTHAPAALAPASDPSARHVSANQRAEYPVAKDHAAAPFAPSLLRRQLLHWLAGGSAVLALGGLSACGGGGGGGSNGGTPPPDPGSSGGSLTPAQRMAVFATLDRHCRELDSRALPVNDYLSAFATFARSQTAFADAGVDADTGSAWARFRDGRLLVLSRSFVPGRDRNSDAGAPAHKSAAPSFAAGKAELPGSSQARIGHSFGTNFYGQTTVTTLSNWLRRHGYQIQAGNEGDARLTQLRQVQGDGVFYLHTHGGSGRVYEDNREVRLYCVTSSTLTSEVMDAMADIREDLDNRRLVYFMAANGEKYRDFLGREQDVMDIRYGITAHFVEHYWQFSANSIVFMNACNSTSDAAAGFVFACQKKGAGVYLGWSRSVSAPAAYDIPEYFFDRLLGALDGANDTTPESPRQRAFAWDDVLGAMRKTGKHIDTHTGAELQARPALLTADPQILAPSIHHAAVDEENKQLVLFGEFGSEPGTVELAGTVLAVDDWNSERIRCNLRDSDPAAGPLLVNVRDHRSNIRHLSEWDLRIDYTWQDEDRPSLQITGVMRLRFRADVGASRDRPGDAPKPAVRYAVATEDSGLPLQAKGSWTEHDCTESWHGRSEFRAQSASAGARILLNAMRMDIEAKTLDLGLSFGTMQTDFEERDSCGTSKPVPISLGLLHGRVDFEAPADQSGMLKPLPALKIPLQNDFVISGGEFRAEQLHLRWQTTAPRFPPVPSLPV